MPHMFRVLAKTISCTQNGLHLGAIPFLELVQELPSRDCLGYFICILLLEMEFKYLIHLLLHYFLVLPKNFPPKNL